MCIMYHLSINSSLDKQILQKENLLFCGIKDGVCPLIQKTTDTDSDIGSSGLLLSSKKQCKK